MKRHAPLLWLPLLVALACLAITAGLWQHERETQRAALRSNFDFGLRQTASRVEQRMASYEQTLRGLRGFADAAAPLDRERFSRYVDAALAGADSAGLRGMAYTPLLRWEQVAAHVAAQRAGGAPDYALDPPGPRDSVAPVTYIAPAAPLGPRALGFDSLADPVRSEAMRRAGDAGSVALTHRLLPGLGSPEGADAVFLMYMPLYTPGPAPGSVQERRARLAGWVSASFRAADLMSSLYGEAAPGLQVRLHDGVQTDEASLIYSSDDPSGSLALAAPGSEASPAAGGEPPARFEVQEYLSVAGHTWTLQVRSTPDFERQYSNPSAGIIAIAGSGLSLVLALLTWQLVTGRERAHAAARRMTTELRDSAERYRRIVETADEGIWTLDAAGHITFVNPKMQQMLGWPAQALLGRHWSDWMDAEGRQAMQGGDGSGRLRSGPAERQQLRLLRKDGSELWVALSTSDIVDDAGHYAGALAMATDITERRLAELRRGQLEAQLLQSQKMEAIGTLAGGIAHDFNNILAAILGNVALAQQTLGAGHAASAGLQQIGHAAARARSLVQQIVAFSRQQPQARVTLALQPLVEETVKLLRSTLPARVELETQLRDPEAHVDADATQLQQVLMNLCTNAWHALQGSTGRIVVGQQSVRLDAEAAERLALRPGFYVHLWVSDNGTGMDEATRLRVFEPFFTTKPVGQGTGLGLSVAHGIVAAHGGAITVSSVPGQGSRFELHLPQAAAPVRPPRAAPPGPSDPTALRGEGEHVLYVDDDPVMLLMVEGLLRRTGYRVTCTDDPREALALVAATRPPFDVVVTDFNMPELSGLDLAQALAASDPELPVVITSGYVSERMRADALAAGVRDVLQKEFTLEQLGAMVHRALAGRAGVDG